MCLFGIRLAGGEKAEVGPVNGGGDAGLVGTPYGAVVFEEMGGCPPVASRTRRSGCLPPFRARASLVQGGALPPSFLDSTSPRERGLVFRSPPKLLLWTTNGQGTTGAEEGTKVDLNGLAGLCLSRIMKDTHAAGMKRILRERPGLTRSWRLSRRGSGGLREAEGRGECGVMRRRLGIAFE